MQDQKLSRNTRTHATSSTPSKKKKNNDKPVKRNSIKFKLFGDISEETLSTFIDTLEDRITPHDDIYILIDSTGGDLQESLAISTILKSLDANTFAINLAKAYSGAALIFMSCANRYSLPYSSFLIHNVKYYPPEGVSYREMNDTKIHYDWLQSTYENVLSTLLGDRSKIMEWLKTETFLTAEEAMQHGLVHNILTEIL